MPNPFKLVPTAADFFVQLDAAIAKTRQLAAQNPGWQLLESIGLQLDAIKKWTQNGRKPTFDERKSITMGRLATRELADTSDPAWEDYKDLVSELSLYFKYWRSDAGLASFDNSDWRTSFPDDYDQSDQ